MATASRAPKVTLLDSSAALAVLLMDHEAHARTLAVVRGRRLGLSGHAWFETFSVLTRLPAGSRRSAAAAGQILARDFPESRFLDERSAALLTEELSRLNIAGGSVFDALVAAAARQHGLPLVSRDLRARPVYEVIGISVELIA